MKAMQVVEKSLYDKARLNRIIEIFWNSTHLKQYTYETMFYSTILQMVHILSF